MEIKLSVRELIEFVLRSGNLDNRFFNNIRGVEGTRAHQKIQKSYDPEIYEAEVYFKYSIDLDLFDQHTACGEDEGEKNLTLQIEGRADGIIRKDEKIIIDEIKSTRTPLEEIKEDHNSLHWAQAKCYGYFLACEENLKRVNIQLTYYHLDEDKSVKFIKTYDCEELEAFFNKLVEEYSFWAFLKQDWQQKRNKSISNLDFPYLKYRKGQREMAVAVYKSIQEEKNLFIEAPTGIGKTISTLFPALKSLREENADKIYYLTAKTIARQAAEKAVSDMRGKGLKLKTIVLTAKDKICFLEERDCTPEVCKYAEGHFDRINVVLKKILMSGDNYNRELITDYALEYRVCPFELSLELCRWSDCIICDYNYFFDPVVSLTDFDEAKSKNSIILVDEAHNLVDRSREMYSAEFCKSFLELLKEKFKDEKKLLNYLSQAEDWIRLILGRNEELVMEDEPVDLYSLLQAVREYLERYLSDKEKKNIDTKMMNSTEVNGISDEVLIDIYFEIFHFLNIADYYGDNYRTIIKNIKTDAKDDLLLTLYCLDPACVIQKLLADVKSTVFFSATLSPLNYYKNVLGGENDDYQLSLASPFPTENKLILNHTGISTRFKDRASSIQDLASIIRETVLLKPGNYLIFFPSYRYLNDTLSYLELPDLFLIISQEKNMTEDKREDFLSFFRNEKSNVIGFTVMSGIFSEGIDLRGDDLIGSIIVGPAHPTLTLERDIIKKYYQKRNSRGYEYAYIYPGLNRVMQAAGRTIRTEKDQGIILLIGRRFNNYNYYRLLPSTFQESIKVSSLEKMIEELRNFWN